MNLSLQRRGAGLIAAGCLALAACGGGGGATSSTSTSSTVSGPNGGTMTIGSWQEQTSTMACNTLDAMTHACAQEQPMWDGLLGLKSNDETGNAKTIGDYYKPALATEVPSTANGDVKTSGCSNAQAKMCVTWKLRTDVTWQTGDKFTSKDVCDLHQFMWLKFGKNNPSALLSTSGWDQVIGCDSSDPAKAVVSYKAIYAPYLTQGTVTGQLWPDSLMSQVLNANGGKGGDVTKVPVNVDLTVGSKNPEAFKGTTTLDKVFVGAGPYVFSSWTPTQQMVEVKNNNYWQKDHPPHLDKIVFKFPADVNSMLASTRAGELQMGLDYRLGFISDLNSLQSSGQIKVQLTPDSGAEHIDLNICASPSTKGLCGPGAKQNAYLADKTIRHAILAGINRQQIVNTLAAGQAAIPADSWLYLGQSYARAADLPTTKYDPAAANKMLDDSGYKLSPNCDGDKTRAFKDGTCINLDISTTAGNKVRENAEPLIQADLAAIGIHVNTPYKNFKSSTFFNSFSGGGTIYTHQYDMAMYTNTDSTPAEPDSYYAEYHGDCGGTCPDSNNIPSAANKGNGQNATGYNSPQVDALFDQGRQVVDLAQRAKIYQQIAKILADDLPDIPLYQQQTVNSYTPKLHNFKRNDIVWIIDAEDWYCTGGSCS